MVSFREVKRRCRADGFQCHHLIPLAVVESQSLAMLFGRLRSTGFNPHDFNSNGMHLPSSEKQAAVFRLPMHRGPHKRYNNMVADRIAGFSNLDDQSILQNVVKLQYDLRKGLRRGPVNLLCGRGGQGNTADFFDRLDSAADLLWGIV